MATKRDGFVDFFKGFLILWVIHIHTVFWSGQHYIPETARQVSLLIDITAFVFISGYLTKPKSFFPSLQRAAKQFINLYINYLVFSCLLLVPLFFAFLLKDNAIPNLTLSVISMLKIDPIGELWGDIPVYHGSIWYIAVYLSTLVLIPFAISFFNTRLQRTITLSIISLLFFFSRYLGWEHKFFFYEASFVYFFLFIFLLGVTYKIEEDRLSLSVLKFSFLVNVAVVFSTLFYFYGGVLELQTKKFPPSIEYLFYSLLLIHIFAILKKMWKYPNATTSDRRLLFFEWCGKNVYFIYLLQAVVCSIPLYFVPILKNYLPVLPLFLVTLTFNIVLTLLATRVYLKFRQIPMDLIKSLVPQRSI